MKIGFFGATRTVTGSKVLVTTRAGEKILIDCGLFQGKDAKAHQYNRHLGFDPAEIDYCILSHAHIDHSGALPYLVKNGFKGSIYSTIATFDLCNIMLRDSAFIQVSDIKYINRVRVAKGKSEVEPLYTPDDAEACLRRFQPCKMNRPVKLGNDITLTFTGVGHILGAAAVNLQIDEGHKTQRLCYTGDIGHNKHKIIKAPENYLPADYIITESTYGDRLHDENVNADESLLQIVRKTCVEKRGKLIIPAFSVGRTQEIVYALDRFSSQGLLPAIPVYVDSPLSTNATEIIRNHPELYNKEVTDYLKKDDDPFCFNRLKYIRETADSIALNDSREPCIIISASGMMEAGRVVHHLKNNLANSKNTVLIVGYCAPNTLGHILKNGAQVVNIYGESIAVRAEILSLEAYSAHGDYKDMIGYLTQQPVSHVQKVFLVHGEEEVMHNYASKLYDTGFKQVVIPHEGEVFEVN